MKLGDQLRKKAAEVQKKKAAKVKKPKIDPAVKMADTIYKRAVKKAKTAAEKGENSCYLSIYSNKLYQDHNKITGTKEAIARLKKEGINGEINFHNTTVDAMESGYGHYQMPSCSMILNLSW